MAIRFLVKQTPTPPGPGGDQDSSDYDRTFTLYGESDPTFNENSKFGSATLKFIGNDQKLTTPANANLNIGTTFTIDFWMRFDPYYVSNGLGTNGGAKIISNHSGGGEVAENGYEIGLTSTGELTATYHGETGKGPSAYTLTTSGQASVITNGGWHHVCWQRSTEGEANVMRIFLDGVSVANTSSQGTTVHNTVTDNPFTIGARAESGATITLPFLYGTIDELEIIEGVAKFSTGGFTPPTSESSSTANHLLLMHFNDDNPTPTIWYDTVDNNYWFTNGSWSGSAWTSFNAQWSAQYGWNTNFRPEKVRITGALSGGGTITLTNNDDFDPEFVIASGSGLVGNPRTITMDTTFESSDSADDLKYLKNMTQFTSVTNVQCDAKPVDPMPA